MTYKRIVLLIAIVASLVSANPRWISMTYEMGFAGSSMKEFIDKPSFEGFGFNFYEGLSDNFMLGGRFGWNNFFQKIDRSSYDFTDGEIAGTITGTQYRNITTMGFTFEGTYVFRNPSQLLPYASVGLGPTWDSKESLIGIWSDYTSTVHFVIRPEAGLVVPISKVGIKVSGGFNGIFNNRDSGADDLSHFTVGIGIALGDFF